MENKRYKDLKVTAGTYVPPEKMDYPEDDPYVGLYKPVYDRDFPAVDASYPYFDMSLRMRILHFLAYHIILRILGWILRFKYGLRWQVEGEEKWHRSSCGVRRWLKQFDLSRGAITIANHCYRHDCASVLTAIHAGQNTRIPMFAPNFRTKDGFFYGDSGRCAYSGQRSGTECDESF